jgi:hypothetical protein
MRFTFLILGIVSILFLIVSKSSFDEISDTSELFYIYSNVSNVIAFFIPFTVFIFCLLTSKFMFVIVDECFEVKKLARILAISFLPIILNCILLLLVLYDFSIGLIVSDFYNLNIISWGIFYFIFSILTKEEFDMNFVKAIAISVFPSLLVIGGKSLFY